MIFDIFVVANDYRQQLFDPFVAEKSFGEGSYKRMNSLEAMKAQGRLYLIYWIKFLLARTVVLSDGEGINVLEHYPLLRFKKVIFFAWNDNDEVKDWKLELVRRVSNLQMVFLIEEPVRESEEKVGFKTFHLRPPVASKISNAGLRFEKRLFFTSEVETQPSFISAGSNLDKKLWALSEKFFEECPISPLDADVRALDGVAEGLAPFRLMWVVRNRTRFLYVKRLKEIYKADFLLKGTCWRALGIEALESDHDPLLRRELYATSKVCLDFMSKTSANAHYPRSAEIVSYSYGILQMLSHDSPEFFGDQVHWRTFTSFKDLQAKIEFILHMPDGEYIERGLILRKRLSTLTNQYNHDSLAGRIAPPRYLGVPHV